MDKIIKYRLEMFFSGWLFCLPFALIGIYISVINDIGLLNGFTNINIMPYILAFVTVVCGFGSLIGLAVAIKETNSEILKELKNLE